MRIDFLLSHNTYSVVNHFGRSLANAFERSGVEVRRYSVKGNLFYKAYHAIQSDPPDFTLSFDLRIDTLPFAFLSPVPHLTLLVDPVILSRIRATFEEDWSLRSEPIPFPAR